MQGDEAAAQRAGQLIHQLCRSSDQTLARSGHQPSPNADQAGTGAGQLGGMQAAGRRTGPSSSTAHEGHSSPAPASLPLLLQHPNMEEGQGHEQAGGQPTMPPPLTAPTLCCSPAAAPPPPPLLTPAEGEREGQNAEGEGLAVGRGGQHDLRNGQFVVGEGLPISGPGQPTLGDGEHAIGNGQPVMGEGVPFSRAGQPIMGNDGSALVPAPSGSRQQGNSREDFAVPMRPRADSSLTVPAPSAVSPMVSFP